MNVGGRYLLPANTLVAAQADNENNEKLRQIGAGGVLEFTEKCLEFQT